MEKWLSHLGDGTHQSTLKSRLWVFIAPGFILCMARSVGNLSGCMQNRQFLNYYGSSYLGSVLNNCIVKLWIWCWQAFEITGLNWLWTRKWPSSQQQRPSSAHLDGTISSMGMLFLCGVAVPAQWASYQASREFWLSHVAVAPHSPPILSSLGSPWASNQTGVVMLKLPSLLWWSCTAWAPILIFVPPLLILKTSL
jgi:hypothetical protein